MSAGSEAIVPFADLRSVYLTGEQIEIADLPPLTTAVLVRTAFGITFDAELEDGVARVSGLPVGTHTVEARARDGAILAEELTGIRDAAGDDPILGFATSFEAEQLPSVLAWLRSLRCTVVQIYDWMERYSAPLPTETEYRDPLGRPLQRPALEQLISGIKETGAVAQAYAPVYATDNDFGEEHRDWRLYRSDGAVQSLGDLLQIMDPGNPSWRQHWLDVYGRAADALGFNGFHLDTYGYPRSPLDATGEPVALDRAYAGFVGAVRAARPRDVISFNQVNGVPRGFTPPERPGFRYVEVWPPNDGWRHLEGLLQRSAGSGARQGDTLAVYPPVWAEARDSALRTAVITEAVATVLGAGTLIWGDNHGALRHPYYVDHERLDGEEAREALVWHRFALRCRDLFRVGVDTSWYEVGDENGAVDVAWEGRSSPEPAGGTLFVRVVQTESAIVVSLIDLTGSTDGSWASATARGNCAGAEVSVLIDSPERWSAHAAVLGEAQGRFQPVATTTRAHREGRAICCTVPIVSGWSVLRIDRD